jgi:hypothetical protein
VPDDLACAETVSTLIKKALPDFPVIQSTKTLDMKLFTDKRFKRELEPKRGRIVISPSVVDKSGTITTHGHVGICISDDRIASNNSFGTNKGKFTGNYSWTEWIEEFKNKQNLRIYVYSLV